MAEKREYLYTAVCHTKCYWLNNLWTPGEVYDGDFPPNKHFSVDGKMLKVEPPKTAGDDPRSNKELRAVLKNNNMSIRRSASRKEIWAKVNRLEMDIGKDELTNPSTGSVQIEDFIAPCGFKAKNEAGRSAHMRRCEKCMEPEPDNNAGDTSEE